MLCTPAPYNDAIRLNVHTCEYEIRSSDRMSVRGPGIDFRDLPISTSLMSRDISV